MISVQEVPFDQIKHLSQMDTGYAGFSKRKSPEIWFVAKQDKKIIGCSCLLLMSKKKVRLSNAFVLKEHRRKGVLKQMVSEREKWALEKKFECIDVRAWEVDYCKFGYSLKKRYLKGAWYEKNL